MTVLDDQKPRRDGGLFPRNRRFRSGMFGSMEGPGHFGENRKAFFKVVIMVTVAVAAVLLGYRFFADEHRFSSKVPYSMLIVTPASAGMSGSMGGARVDVDGGRLHISSFDNNRASAGSSGGPMGRSALAARPERGVIFDIDLSPENEKRVIDAMGGILINIPETIEYHGKDGLPVRIDAGMRRLDADRVEAYLLRPNSSRTSSLRAIVLGATSRGAELIASKVDLTALIDAALDPAAKGVDGKNAARIAGLLTAASHLGPTDIVIDWQSPASGAEPPAPSPQTVAPAVAPPVLKIRILNGIGKSGLAARVIKHLPRSRFDAVETANADRFGYARTVIACATRAQAEEVAVALGLGDIEVRSVRSGADVEVILGADSRKLW